MSEEFNPSWINVMEKIVMEQFNKYQPGFICIGHKPHPVDNDSHTIYCSLTSIFWRAQIVEGKYHPQQFSQKECEELGKLVSLMLRRCGPIFGTGKDVALGSGFFVAKGIIEI